MRSRLAESELRELLATRPITMVVGPRQCGKSTLAQTATRDLAGWTEVTLDDPAAVALARTDPESFLKGYPGPLLIDEVQRAPELFLPLKAAVDRDRKPGRYLLTGSANVLVLPKLADALVGRLAVLDLAPFTQAELHGESSTFLDRLFAGQLGGPSDLGPPVGPSLEERVVTGGFPEPALMGKAQHRERWFDDYIRTLVERDVRDLAQIDSLTQVPRLVKLLAARSGDVLNVTALSRESGVPATTLSRYLDLLRALYLLQPVPAWSADPGTRLIKSPRLYFVDSGLASRLVGQSAAGLAKGHEAWGTLLRTFLANELRRLAPYSDAAPTLYHLRTVKHLEVDFVLESRDGRIAGIKIRPDGAARVEDAEGLLFLRELAGDRFAGGLVLHPDDRLYPLGPDLKSMPISALWRTVGG